MKILETAHHRNGVGGVGFYVVRFTDWEGDDGVFNAIIPDHMNPTYIREAIEEGYDYHKVDGVECYVLKEGMDTIAFFENSWRGDRAFSDLMQFADLWARIDRDADARINKNLKDIAADAAARLSSH